MRSELADLDAALADVGRWVTLRRVVGTAPNTANVDVKIRVMVEDVAPENSIGGVHRIDSMVFMSPTDIANAGWPGGELPTDATPIPSLPRRGDLALIDGRWRAVELVQPRYVDDEIVRINMRVLG